MSTAAVALSAIAALIGLCAWQIHSTRRPHPELPRAIHDLCAELRAARKDLQ